MIIPGGDDFPDDPCDMIGPFIAGPGSLSTLAGQTWEAVAIAYNPFAGLISTSNYQQLAW